MQMRRVTKYAKADSGEMKTCCVDFMNKECMGLMGECGRCSTNDEAWDNLRYYEELKEQGRLVILPEKKKGDQHHESKNYEGDGQK